MCVRERGGREGRERGEREERERRERGREVVRTHSETVGGGQLNKALRDDSEKSVSLGHVRKTVTKVGGDAVYNHQTNL